jgi:hypothetical protein
MEQYRVVVCDIKSNMKIAFLPSSRWPTLPDNFDEHDRYQQLHSSRQTLSIWKYHLAIGTQECPMNKHIHSRSMDIMRFLMVESTTPFGNYH